VELLLVLTNIAVDFSCWFALDALAALGLARSASTPANNKNTKCREYLAH
jgi:hypothetical protein